MSRHMNRFAHSFGEFDHYWKQPKLAMYPSPQIRSTGKLATTYSLPRAAPLEEIVRLEGNGYHGQAG